MVDSMAMKNVVWGMVLVVVLVATAEASTPPGIANNPSHARCLIKKYKMCYNLEHVCPKFCPDSCTVECVSCKPICSGGSAPPPESDGNPLPPSNGDEGKGAPPPQNDGNDQGGKGDGKDKGNDQGGKGNGNDQGGKGDDKGGKGGGDDQGGKGDGNGNDKGGKGGGDDQGGKGDGKGAPPPKAESPPPPVTPSPTPPKVESPPPPPPVVTPSPPHPATPTPAPSPQPSSPHPPISPPTPSSPPSPSPISPPTPTTPPPTISSPSPSPISPPTPATPEPSPPSPTPSSPSPSPISPPTPETPKPSTSPISPPTPQTPQPTPPSSPSPQVPVPPTQSPSPPSPFPSPPVPTPPTPSPSPPSPSPSPPVPVPPTPPSPPTPPEDSSEAAAGRRQRCKNKNYPQCYGVDHVCPAACPHTCEVDCVTCKPVCKCDMPGAVCQDPRFIGGDGITFYFHGKKDKDFCLVTQTDLHINAHFIGKTNQNMNRDFTWVQSIAILFGDHQLFLGAQKTTTWNDDVDRFSLSFDGEPIALSATEGSTWQAAALPTTTIRRDIDTNSLIIQVDGLFRISAKLVPITQHESRVHNYGITQEDCFAHLELGFKFFSLSRNVDGVLGQTYRANYVSRAKMGVAMPVLGGETEFAVSNIFAADCAVSRFQAGKSSPENHYVSSLELPSMKCGSGMDGKGVVCKK